MNDKDKDPVPTWDGAQPEKHLKTYLRALRWWSHDTVVPKHKQGFKASSMHLTDLAGTFHRWMTLKSVFDTKSWDTFTPKKTMRLNLDVSFANLPIDKYGFLYKKPFKRQTRDAAAAPPPPPPPEESATTPTNRKSATRRASAALGDAGKIGKEEL